jgi:hypothetical protein
MQIGVIVVVAMLFLFLLLSCISLVAHFKNIYRVQKYWADGRGLERVGRLMTQLARNRGSADGRVGRRRLGRRHRWRNARVRRHSENGRLLRCREFVNVDIICARRRLPKAEAGKALFRSIGHGEAQGSDKILTDGAVAVPADRGSVEDAEPLRNTDHLVLRGHHREIDGFEERDFQGVQLPQGDACYLGHVVVANEEIAIGLHAHDDARGEQAVSGERRWNAPRGLGIAAEKRKSDLNAERSVAAEMHDAVGVLRQGYRWDGAGMERGHGRGARGCDVGG